MGKGGRRSTTWAPTWKSGKTTVIRVPEVLAEEILRIARVIDEGQLPVTGNTPEAADSYVTGNCGIDEGKLKEAADTFLMTIPPRDRRAAKRLLYRFIDALWTTQRSAFT